MEFVVILLPFLLPGLVFMFQAEVRMHVLAALLAAWCPEAVAQARGRPRAWYDRSDAHALGNRRFRERAVRVATAAGAPDVELAKAAAAVERTVRWANWALVGGLCLGMAVCVAVGRALA